METSDIEESYKELDDKHKKLSSEYYEKIELFESIVHDLEDVINKLKEVLQELYGYLLMADRDGESHIPESLAEMIESILNDTKYSEE